MAEIKPATKTAKNLFGSQTADRIVFRLLQKNPKIRPDTPMYPPYIRIPNKEIIKSEDGEGEVQIRLLKGFKSIYAEEQEKGNRAIAENILNNSNNRIEIIDGQIAVPKHDSARIEFLRKSNRNIDSEFRTGKSIPIFSEYSEAKETESLVSKQKIQKAAFDKAFEATDEQILFHAKYLGVRMLDDTLATRTDEAIRADYRQLALDDPKNFLKTFDDRDLKDKFLIDQAFEKNVIGTSVIPGKIAVVGNKEELCDLIPGMTPAEALFAYTRTSKEGGAFLEHLRKK